MAWVAVQQKAFTRWCNTILEKRNLTINDLTTDLNDGILLVQLLEILTSKTIKHNRKPRIDVQKMENHSASFIALNEVGIKLVNIGPDDILQGNQKLILGLVWQMILHFKMQAKEGGSANKELLEWVNSKIPAYNIKNFDKDWQSGKAICALVEAVLPGQMKLPADFKNDPVKDAEMGILKAKNNMGIPQIIDPDDLAHNPDQLAIMTYVSYFKEYAHQYGLRVDQQREITPFHDNCIVYGPGLEAGNDQGIETYFTIEIRNEFNRKVPSGGHNIGVRITGPHTQNTLQTFDKKDGTYYVTYTPEEDGNYVIEVNLDHKHIQGSPFHVKINKVEGEKDTLPVPHWFFMDLVDKTWKPYGITASNEIEENFIKYPGAVFTLSDGVFKIDLGNMKEVNTKKKHLLSYETRDIIRGTWFWQFDQNTWLPYDTEWAAALEKEFQKGTFSRVDVCKPGAKKIRYVAMLADGTFKQFRQAKDAGEGRPVLRGYKGQVIEKEKDK